MVNINSIFKHAELLLISSIMLSSLKITH